MTSDGPRRSARLGAYPNTLPLPLGEGRGEGSRNPPETASMLMARIALRAAAIALTIATTLLFGCNRSQTQSLGPDSLTPETARDALIVLVSDGDDPLLRSTLEALRQSKPIVEGEAIWLGPWRCDFSQKTFVLTSDSPHHFVEYSGHFERGPSGRWIATIDSVTRT
jgi:hypothetical protein